jgi:hypothetical protein
MARQHRRISARRSFDGLAGAQVLSRAAFLLIIAFAAWAWSRPTAASEQVTAEVLRYGLVKDKQIGTKPSPGSPSGLSGVVSDYDFVRATLSIEACPGTVMGVENRLSRSLRKSDEPLVMRYEYPKQVTPDGRTFTTHDMPLDPGGTDVYAGFTFEYPWEMVSGEWTFRLMQGHRELSATHFTVRVGACLVS